VNRRLLAFSAVATATALAVVPAAQAATKKKPKPIKGSYTVTLVPDPSGVSGAIDDPVDGTCSVNPASSDVHTFKVPAKGTLGVLLEMQNPTGTGQPEGLDWDLMIRDGDGEEIASGTSFAAREETFTKFKKKQTISIVACNWTGLPEAKISYTFTYQ